MPAFRYEAVDPSGITKKGVVNADSARAARADLRVQGLVPITVDAIASQVDASGKASGGKLFGDKLSNVELALLTRQLSSLLEAGLPLYGLTNWSADTFELGERMFPILRDFLYVAVSGRLGMVKPDPEIYLHLLNTCGLSAESCLFIDDAAKNVEAARQLGLQAIQFTEAKTVEQQLRELGLPI